MHIYDTADRSSYRPIRLPHGVKISSAIKKIKSEHPELTIADPYLQNLEELFLLRNPKYRYNKKYKNHFEFFVSKHAKEGLLLEAGSWFYFPWLNQVVHFLPEKLHLELRTGRNKYLITQEEQEKFYKANIGILGMSVGSHAAITIVMTGGAKHIKIADPDKISGDNLNRIRSGFQHVGTPKVISVCRQIYEINPYSKVELFPKGLTDKNMNKFLSGLDLLVEEMDVPYLKISVRFAAREKGIPVIMGADNGDSNIVDIERYDQNKKLPILHGIMGDMTLENFKAMPAEDLPKVMAKLAGADIAVPRMLESVTEVGKSLYSWPQLGTAATMCGAVLSNLARRIISKDKNIVTGRYEMSQDSVFEKGYNSAISVKKRKQKFDWFKNKMNSLS